MPIDTDTVSNTFNFNNLYYLLMMVLFVGIIMMPYLSKAMKLSKRKVKLKAIEKKRHSRVITLIHRQESTSFLGIMSFSYLDIENAIDIIKAIRLTPIDMPIDLILHTPGGIAFAAEQISRALRKHKGKVTAFIPHYAMSAGSLLSVTADEIKMSPHAVIGPTDPQLPSGLFDQFPSASIVRAMSIENPNREDKFLILADISRMAVKQLKDEVYQSVIDKVTPEQAEIISNELGSGIYTHDHPFSIEKVRELGLKVSTDVPQEIYDLLDCYDTPKSSVIYDNDPKTPNTLKILGVEIKHARKDRP